MENREIKTRGDIQKWLYELYNNMTEDDIINLYEVVESSTPHVNIDGDYIEDESIPNENKTISQNDDEDIDLTPENLTKLAESGKYTSKKPLENNHITPLPYYLVEVHELYNVMDSNNKIIYPQLWFTEIVEERDESFVVIGTWKTDSMKCISPKNSPFVYNVLDLCTKKLWNRVWLPFINSDLILNGTIGITTEYISFLFDTKKQCIMKHFLQNAKNKIDILGCDSSDMIELFQICEYLQNGSTITYWVDSDGIKKRHPDYNY